jgi:hypothetical protein
VQPRPDGLVEPPLELLERVIGQVGSTDAPLLQGPAQLVELGHGTHGLSPPPTTGDVEPEPLSTRMGSLACRAMAMGLAETACGLMAPTDQRQRARR